MSTITTALPSEPVYDYEDPRPITDEEIAFCAVQTALRLDYEETGPLNDQESLFCAEECFLAYDREEAAGENALQQ